MPRVRLLTAQGVAAARAGADRQTIYFLSHSAAGGGAEQRLKHSSSYRNPPEAELDVSVPARRGRRGQGGHGHHVQPGPGQAGRAPGGRRAGGRGRCTRSGRELCQAETGCRLRAPMPCGGLDAAIKAIGCLSALAATSPSLVKLLPVPPGAVPLAWEWLLRDTLRRNGYDETADVAPQPNKPSLRAMSVDQAQGSEVWGRRSGSGRGGCSSA